MKRFILALSLLCSVHAYAWKETGGGDEVGLDFTRCFNTALTNLEAAGAISGPDESQFRQITNMIRVAVVNHDLPVQAGEAVQDSVATNDPKRLLITVNRARWVKLKDAKQKEAIALHEVLSIIGVESTGEYTYSEQYVALTKGLAATFTVPTSVEPKAKTLNCHVQYDGPKNGGLLPTELHDISLKLVKNPDPEKLQLNAQQDFITKDGRFHVYVWGVQPFRTKLNPTGYEYTGLEADDLLNKNSSVVGSILNPAKNEDHAELSQTFDRTDTNMGDLSVDCTLN